MSLLRELVCHRGQSPRGVQLLLTFSTIGLLCLHCQCESNDTPEPAAQSGNFLAAPLKPAGTSPASDVAPVLISALGVIFGGWGEEASARLGVVQEALRPAFEAHPKDFWKRGTLGASKTGGIRAPDALRAMTYSYFAQQHGWLIRDLEPPYMVKSSQQLHEVSVLSKAPIIVQALKALEMQHQGLSLGDLAAVVTSIERLLVDESAAVLKSAYSVNDFNEMEAIDMPSLHKVLESYLLIFRGSSDGKLLDSTGHMDVKAKAQEDHQNWQAMQAFASESIGRFMVEKIEGRSSGLEPTVNRMDRQAELFYFEDVGQIVRDMALHYGQWQDVECRAMRNDLLALDKQHTGRVSFETFHKQDRNPVYGYQFTESEQYLQETGSLEWQEGQPQVLIANYMLGPSNCMGTTEFLSVCCLNSCEALAGEVYRQAHSESVTPAVLANIARNLSTPLAISPTEKIMFLREPKVIQELYDMAATTNGQVMLSTPEFRQWLHQAFPGQCPSLHPSTHAPPTPAEPSAGAIEPGAKSAPTVPPSHRPNPEECTRTPVYYL